MSESEDLSTEDGPVARRSRLDIFFSLGVVALSALLLLWAIPDGVQVPASVKAAPLSPAFLPNVLSALVGLLGAICLVQATLGRGVPKEASELSFEAARSWPLRLAMVLAAFLAFWLLPEEIGMLPVAIGVMAALIFAGGERNVARGALLAVLIPLGVWLFFSRVAQVPLPEGPIEALFPL